MKIHEKELPPSGTQHIAKKFGLLKMAYIIFQNKQDKCSCPVMYFLILLY